MDPEPNLPEVLAQVAVAGRVGLRGFQFPPVCARVVVVGVDAAVDEAVEHLDRCICGGLPVVPIVVVFVGINAAPSTAICAWVVRVSVSASWRLLSLVVVEPWSVDLVSPLFFCL